MILQKTRSSKFERIYIRIFGVFFYPKMGCKVGINRRTDTVSGAKWWKWAYRHPWWGEVVEIGIQTPSVGQSGENGRTDTLGGAKW